jgi:hypothetical protein
MIQMVNSVCLIGTLTQCKMIHNTQVLFVKFAPHSICKVFRSRSDPVELYYGPCSVRVQGSLFLHHWREGEDGKGPWNSCLAVRADRGGIYVYSV